MKSLESARNLGPKSARLLREAGIASLEDLRAIGPVAAYCRLKFTDARSVSLNMLWALHGAVKDRDWRDLAPQTKARLRAEVAAEGPRCK